MITLAVSLGCDMSELSQIIPTDIYEAYAPILNANEFLDGMRDAKEGNDCKVGMGEEYVRGYHAQYVAEQNRSMY